MKKRIVISFFLLLLLSMISTVAADTEKYEVNGDLFIIGDEVSIDEPVDGDVYAFGGNITINATITGDLIVAGGMITINEDIQGKLLSAGGTVDIKGEVYKAIVVGGTVKIHETGHIMTNAYLVGGQVENYGTIEGELRVSSGTFNNYGSYKGFEKLPFITFDTEPFDSIRGGLLALSFIIMIIGIVVTIGHLLMGVLLLKYFKKWFIKVETEIRNNPLVTTIVGFVMIIVSILGSFVLMVTLIGLPLGFLFILLTIMALFLSNLFVSLALGRKLGNSLKIDTSDTWLLVLGFIVLRILIWVPIIGFFISVISSSLGFGAILYAIRNNWDIIAQKT